MNRSVCGEATIHTAVFVCIRRKDGYKVNHRKSYDALYLKAYRQQNPEKQEKWRIRSEIRHLESYGYTVSRKKPEEMTVAELENRIGQDRDRQREYQRRWKENNRDRLREYHRQYRKDHPEKYRISPEKQREYAARWRAKHKDEIRKYARDWYANNKEKARASQARWRKNNPHYQQLRRQRYKSALEKAQQEQRARIRRESREAKQKGVNEND